MFKVWKILCGVTLTVLLICSLASVVDTAENVVSNPDPDYCTSHHKGDEPGCLADHEHNCVWCTAKAVKSACYDTEVAKQLPPSIFKCSNSSTVGTEPVVITE